MKKKLMLVLAAVLVIGAFGFTACGQKPEQSVGVGYGLVHRQYAGKVTVTVDKTNKITDVVFQEYLPLSNIANQGALITDADHKDGTYAKWVKIGDQVFTLNAEGNGYTNDKWTTGDYVLSNSSTIPEGKKSAYENAEFTKWYIEEVCKGNFFIGKDANCTATYSDTEIPFTTYAVNTSASGTAVSTQFFKVTKSTWCDKSVNGYWTIATVSDTVNETSVNIGTQTQLGWKINMAAMKEAILAYGLDGYTGTETKSGTWGLGSNSTGATLTDYHQYMGLAKVAYDAAKKAMA